MKTPAVGACSGMEIDNTTGGNTDGLKHKHGNTAKNPTLLVDLDEEIANLYNCVPEVANNFIILDRIGEGAFSTVYKARLKHYPDVQEIFALKHIIPTSHPSRIENELKCLLKIGGRDNVMGVKLCLRHRDNVIVVMPLFAHDKFQDILPLIAVWEMREYMRNLLISLQRVHEFSVIHRDIKPSNFLYNRQTKQYALVDFGLASFSSNLAEEASGKHKSDERRLSLGGARLSLGGARLSLGGARQSLGGASSRSHARELRSPLSPSKRAVNKSNIAACPSRGTADKFCKAGPSWRQTSSRRSAPPVIPPVISTAPGLCGCFGKPVVCHLCVARSNQLAPRAGTAGFRPPEVLIKSNEQDTGVDVWSAGVIFLSMLSGRYPFFRAQDDMGYLAQILSLLGTTPCVQAAYSFGKLLTVSEDIPPVDLRFACHKLRASQINPRTQTPEVRESWDTALTDLPFDLLRQMLDPNPKTRISAHDALQHPFFSEADSPS